MGLTHRRDLLAPIIVPVPRRRSPTPGRGLLGLPAGTPISCGPFRLPRLRASAPASATGRGRRAADRRHHAGLHGARRPARRPTATRPASVVATGEPGRWLRAMPAMVGTASMDWMLRIARPRRRRVERRAGDQPARRGRCRGAAVPRDVRRARAVRRPARVRAITGVRLTTTRDDLLRAMCEGSPTRHGTASSLGGLTADRRCRRRDPVANWLQVFADVLGYRWSSPARPRSGPVALCSPRPRRAGRSSTSRRGPPRRTSWSPIRRDAGALHDGYGRYLDHVRAARPFWATRQASASVSA